MFIDSGFIRRDCRLIISRNERNCAAHEFVRLIVTTNIPRHTESNNGSAGTAEGTPRRSRILSRCNERMCCCIARNGCALQQECWLYIRSCVERCAMRVTPYARAFLTAPPDCRW